MRRRRRCGLIIGVLGAGTLAGCTTPAPVILRVATFNTALSRPQPGRLAEALARGDDARARGVASIIRTVRPDAILLNEFDTDDVAALDHFRNAFLQDGPPDGPPAWTFAYAFVAPSNSGVPTGLDLDRDGAVDGPGDAHGFGRYPG
ncbi:MAG: hypothetical protein KDA25_01825, partial [Phycisphaerales bacterium]|nr:hypothetical protein [Phycisphaerales bacterium]